MLQILAAILGLSLLVIVLVLIASVSFSLQRTRSIKLGEMAETPPPPDER